MRWHAASKQGSIRLPASGNPIISHQEVSRKISKSVQEVSKRNSFSKSDARYWKTRIFRNSYTRGGVRVETNNWCLKLAHGGKRETVN